ncbi:MAG: M17 family peptidase N-terminal domain-containing protein, partial [Nitriliruptoraceae bacterium]
MIELVTRAGGLEDVDAPLRAVGAFAPAGEADGDAPRRPVPTASAAAALAPLGDPVDELVALGFDGAAGSTVRVRVPGDAGPRTVLVVGLGPAERCTRDVLRRAAGVAVRAAADVEVLATDLAAVAAVADVTGPGSATPAAVLRAVAEGALLGAYRFDAYRSRPRPMRLGRVVLAGVAPDGADDALARARAGAKAATW